MPSKNTRTSQRHEEFVKRFFRDRYMDSSLVTVDNSGLVSYSGSVVLDGGCFVGGVLPFRFKLVVGDFFIRNTNLRTLAGCPCFVGGAFSCFNSPELESLEGGPIRVDGKFYSVSCCQKLKNFRGAPMALNGNLCCGNLPLINPQEIPLGFPKDIGGTVLWVDGSRHKTLSKLHNTRGKFLAASKKVPEPSPEPQELSYTCPGKNEADVEVLSDSSVPPVLLDNKQEEGRSIMNTIQNTVSRTVDANKSAAVVAAKIEAGRIVLSRAKAGLKVIPGVAGSAAEKALDSPLGEWLIANVVQLAQKNFAAGNEKAEVVADAVLQASYVNGFRGLDLDGLFTRAIEGIDLSKLSFGKKEG